MPDYDADDNLYMRDIPHLTRRRVAKRGNASIEWQDRHWYWEVRLDDTRYGEAIGGPAVTHRAAQRAVRRTIRREGIGP